MLRQWTGRVYDNTLRDGEQTPGVCFSGDDKRAIACLLADAGVRCLEAGFAGVSREEEQAVKAVAEAGLGAEVFSLARLRAEDIQAAVRAKVQGITLIAPASEKARALWHGNKSLAPLLEAARRGIEAAKHAGLKVKFSCVDATRTPMEQTLRIYLEAQEAGADMVSYPDTLGVAMPEEIFEAIRALKNALRIPVSFHGHNDLGLAVANSLAAVRAGADEVQTTVNGLGERAGNTPLEEWVMAMRVGYQLDTGVAMGRLTELSELVRRLSGQELSGNKPIVGRNAFRHESGIHAQGLLAGGRMYEPFPPEWIGRRHEIAFGKHSGKSNLRSLYPECGLQLTRTQEKKILGMIKRKAQAQKRELERAEVMQIIFKAGVCSPGRGTA